MSMNEKGCKIVRSFDCQKIFESNPSYNFHKRYFCWESPKLFSRIILENQVPLLHRFVRINSILNGIAIRKQYRGSPTSTVSTSTISTSMNFIAIGIKLVLLELLFSKISTSGNWLCSTH